MNANKPTTRVVREIFSPDSEGREYYNVVSPQEFEIEITYCEHDKEIAAFRIPLDTAEEIAHAIIACAKEMRAQNESGCL